MCCHEIITPECAVQLIFEETGQKVKAEAGYQIMLTVYAADEMGNPYFRETYAIILDGDAGGYNGHGSNLYVDLFSGYADGPDL